MGRQEDSRKPFKNKTMRVVFLFDSALSRVGAAEGFSAVCKKALGSVPGLKPFLVVASSAPHPDSCEPNLTVCDNNL
jgi:hypothetical protein